MLIIGGAFLLVHIDFHGIVAMPATRLLTGTDTRCIKMSKKAVFSFLAFIRRVRALLSVSVELLVCGSHRALGGSGALALLRARSVSCSV